MRVTRTLVLALMLPLSACTGVLDGSKDAGQGSASSVPPGPGAGSGGGGGTMSSGGVASVDNGLPGRSLIRRLSNVEYDATIKTLLSDETDYAAAFPTDSVVNGFTNNTDVQDVGPALAEQLLVVAEKIAAAAVKNPDALLGCPLSDGDSCVSSFIDRFGKRAWRRPIDAAERDDLLSVYRSARDTWNPSMGLQLLLETLLVSPSFLYRVEVGTPVAGQPYAALTSWELASRLSYFLTGTMPDGALFAAAESGSLNGADVLSSEAKRLLSTKEARQQVASFFDGWLNLRAVERLERSPEQFPKWNSGLPALLTAESRAFTTNVVFDGAGDFKTLLTAPFTYGDPQLAAFYGGQAGPVENGIARIELPPNQRAGILTQASFLATHAKEIQTDPVARGKFIRERILCQGLQPPPPELMVKAPVITPGTTTRQRFTEHEANPVCASCHRLIDPVGLAFENYDAAGLWRDQEQGLTIDASGDLTGTDVSGPLNGVVEMTGKLAQSQVAAECFVRNWFRFTFGRGESDNETPRMTTIASSFQANSGNVQALLVALTQTPDFRYLAPQGTP